MKRRNFLKGLFVAPIVLKAAKVESKVVEPEPESIIVKPDDIMSIPLGTRMVCTTATIGTATFISLEDIPEEKYRWFQYGPGKKV